MSDLKSISLMMVGPRQVFAQMKAKRLLLEAQASDFWDDAHSKL